MSELPWSDLKVAFDITDPDGLWRAIDSARPPRWPKGWKLVETDSRGMRDIAIFEVSVLPAESDGERVRRLLTRFRT